MLRIDYKVFKYGFNVNLSKGLMKLKKWFFLIQNNYVILKEINNLLIGMKNDNI